MSLIELLTTVGIASIVLTLGVPAFNEVAASIRRERATSELTDAFALARSEAARRGLAIRLCPTGGGTGCSNQAAWNLGWMVFVDIDENGSPGGAGEDVIYAIDWPNPRFTVTPDGALQAGVVFRSSGFPSATGNLAYCDAGESRTFLLTFVGRIEPVATGAGCP